MRERLVAVAMELFGRQGFKATTIAQIEKAAGLSIGAGGMYRHFSTKRALLEAGVRRQADNGADLISFIADPARLTPCPARSLARGGADGVASAGAAA